MVSKVPQAERAAKRVAKAQLKATQDASPKKGKCCLKTPTEPKRSSLSRRVVAELTLRHNTNGRSQEGTGRCIGPRTPSLLSECRRIGRGHQCPRSRPSDVGREEAARGGSVRGGRTPVDASKRNGKATEQECSHEVAVFWVRGLEVFGRHDHLSFRECVKLGRGIVDVAAQCLPRPKLPCMRRRRSLLARHGRRRPWSALCHMSLHKAGRDVGVGSLAVKSVQ